LFRLLRQRDVREDADRKNANAPRGFISQSRAFFEDRYLERETGLEAVVVADVECRSLLEINLYCGSVFDLWAKVRQVCDLAPLSFLLEARRPGRSRFRRDAVCHVDACHQGLDRLARSCV
jgi:hypothetical protein